MAQERAQVVVAQADAARRDAQPDRRFVVGAVDADALVRRGEQPNEIGPVGAAPRRVLPRHGGTGPARRVEDLLHDETPLGSAAVAFAHLVAEPFAAGDRPERQRIPRGADHGKAHRLLRDEQPLRPARNDPHDRRRLRSRTRHRRRPDRPQRRPTRRRARDGTAGRQQQKNRRTHALIRTKVVPAARG